MEPNSPLIANNHLAQSTCLSLVQSLKSMLANMVPANNNDQNNNEPPIPKQQQQPADLDWPDSFIQLLESLTLKQISNNATTDLELPSPQTPSPIAAANNDDDDDDDSLWLMDFAPTSVQPVEPARPLERKSASIAHLDRPTDTCLLRRRSTLPLYFNQITWLHLDKHSDQLVLVQDFDDEEAASVEPIESAGASQSLSPAGTGPPSVAATAADDEGKHSLLQFALHNFREAVDKYSLESRASKAGGDTSTLRGSLKLIETLRRGAGPTTNRLLADWSWRELAEMVKFTRSPPKHPLLKLASEELERRALDCFSAVMQYMGDLAPAKAPVSGEVDCVYLILMNCHNFPALRDEVYCQLMKQTTSNRSDQPDSCLRGWRLFSILAAYFDCSPQFRPYLVKYLETAAYDKRRAYCSVAGLCLQNLRKTFRFGGRKNVPSIEEIAATSAGRNSKRQIYRLPGGTERVINTKSTTVVEDIIEEICLEMLNVTEEEEMLEFSLYCIADGDLYTMPLSRDEYILDITTELIKNHQHYFLIFCRSIWHYPLRLDSRLYIEVIFNQIAPDYLEGLLLVLGGGQAPSNSGRQLRLRAKLVREVARIAALLHRAAGTECMPSKDEVRYLIPKPIVAAMKRAETRSPASSASSQSSATSQDQEQRDQADLVLVTPSKWVELVQGHWQQLSALDTLDAKAQFLDIVRHWPLFGSSFFAIKLIQRDLLQPLDFILALNKLGIHMLDLSSHQTVHQYAFNEVLSTRKVRSEDGALFLDLKCGNLMKRTIIRIQTDQAHEISRLIRQYIDIELLQHQKHVQPVDSA